MGEKHGTTGTDDLLPHIETAIRQFEHRRDGMLTWLENQSPSCFDEQLHVVNGTRERVYWHYGYRAALCDAIALLRRVLGGEKIGVIN